MTAVAAASLPRHGRRAVLRLAAASLGAAGLTACGFKLRGDVRLAFRSIRLGFAPRSMMGLEVQRQLSLVPDLRIVETDAQAEVVMDVLTDQVTRVVSASTSAGQVREFAITVKLRFRLRTPAGRELVAPTELAQAQTLSYNESAALAKESEEAQVVESMRREIAAQVMRRLAAVRL